MMVAALFTVGVVPPGYTRWQVKDSASTPEEAIAKGKRLAAGDPKCEWYARIAAFQGLPNHGGSMVVQIR